jgi:hypothetical protein
VTVGDFVYKRTIYCRPGDRVPISGIYVVVHDAHRSEHPVSAIRGEVFPHCRVCKEKVKFRFSAEAEYILYDPDLRATLETA